MITNWIKKNIFRQNMATSINRNILIEEEIAAQEEELIHDYILVLKLKHLDEIFLNKTGIIFCNVEDYMKVEKNINDTHFLHKNIKGTTYDPANYLTIDNDFEKPKFMLYTDYEKLKLSRWRDQQIDSILNED